MVDDAGLRDTVLAQRVTRVRLRQIQSQVLRSPPAYVVTDLFLLWLVAGVGLLWTGIAWMALDSVLFMGRWFYVRARMRRPSASPQAELSRLSAFYLALGLGRALLTLWVFRQPLSDIHYLYTVVMLGLAAVGVSLVGGMARIYALWSVAMGASLAWGWLSQGSVLSLGFGFLIPMMLLMLTLFVRDQGRSQVQLVTAAYENERLAESLRLERDKAQAANQSKTRFFAAASHDLRQPLHALAINATTLELVARRQTDPVVKELSQSINRALRQSNSLLDGLLDISRLDANAVEVRIEAVDVAALLEAVCDEFKPVAAQAGLALAVELPAAPALWIATDADLMKRVLGNLLSNALKFTSVGGVTLAARSDAGQVLISVADTGPGIALAEQERVFEEFYQIGNASRDRTLGLGLGLSIVRRSAELLGVGLRMNSAPGQGTVMELRVPAAEPAAGTGANPLGGVEALPQLDARVLVIDDEDEILEALAGLLPHLGCEVRVATGSQQALAVLDAGFEPDVLLVDHRLRGETGPQVIAQLRERCPQVPAVLVTGDTSPLNLRSLQNIGFQVVHKPVDGQRLAQALGEALRGSPSRSGAETEAVLRSAELRPVEQHLDPPRA